MGFNKVAVIVVCLAVATTVGLRMVPRINLPSHLLGHKAMFFPTFLENGTRADLLDLVRDMATFPTNVQDVRFYKAVHEDIGEAQPIGADGGCEHPYLTPNNARDKCVLPGRIDIGRHFIMTGGWLGLKESYAKSISRVQSFGRYLFDLDDYPLVKGLFDQEKFKDAALSVCPASKPVLDPFQFNFIVQIPGQSVATHIDAPYFWGASRFQYPQWLLAVMVFSGLFNDKFVDQVQVVAYVHQWNDTTGAKDGNFIYWTENEPMPLAIPPLSGGGSAVDGSKTVHAAGIYLPGRSPPLMDKSRNNRLQKVDGKDEWILYADDEELARYDTDDLRITIVYRAKCFESEEQRQLYNDTKDTDVMPLEEILAKLAADLVLRGKVKTEQEALSMPRLDLAMLLLDTYVKYPLPPKALVPWNYCALTRLLPATNAFLKYIC